ncbi:MAG: glycoside hydrolase family 31 protein [Paludibacter sp.]|nr:glycoside hydrolase family 31 protein [Paludibacter sp.]
MKKLLVLILALCGYFMIPAQNNPVTDGNARFTLLTPHMVRMEYDSTGKFVDSRSFVAINRDLPAVSFTKKQQGKLLILKTSYLEIRYKTGSGKFTPENLQITYSENPNRKIVWKPGMKNTGNLKGTFRTLDGLNGDTHVDEKAPKEFEPGLISRDGWYVIDDTNNFLFDNSDWSWVQERRNKETDWYFMGYGSNYKTALKEFTVISGKVPLPPRYAFGYWWSRYWNYSDDEIRDLVKKFNQYNIPLDVLVIDMDWHLTDGVSFRKESKKDEFGQPIGWTGYTWNKALFPDPDQLLSWIKENNLKTTLNLHPASGIAPYEEKYAEFANAMKFDTIGHKNIPFEAADKKFMTNLFDIVLNPIRDKGVDFWWLDWQQWPYSKTIAKLSNTWWLNYCFFTEMERQTTKRPMLYHRWGGLGNHRYEVGFSGDMIISWKSLEFQPYFTSTASNVLYGYWSHDLGGHMFGNIPDDLKKIDPEMYTRWMQYGVFSPMFRTHSSKDPRLKKEIWNFTGDYFEALQGAIRLRYDLAPYIYTMARKTYDTGISLCRPMYYDYPESEEAYSLKTEYMFGDDLLVVPVTTPSVNNLSTVKVWLPSGTDWYEWSTGTLLKGGQTLERRFLLNEYPVYVKAGAILPMNTEVKNLQQNNTDLILKVFAAGNYTAKLYEDAGDNNDYQKNACTFTTIQSVKEADGTFKLTVLPREGSFPEMIQKRNMEVQLYGSVMPDKVSLNGVELKYDSENKGNSWGYSGNQLTVNIRAHQVDCSQKTEIKVQFPTQTVDVNGVIGKMSRLKKAVTLFKNNWFDGAPIPGIISSTNQLDVRINYQPTHFEALIRDFNLQYPQIGDIMDSTHVAKSVVSDCRMYLGK